jgi:PAS domain S-box-containing protein
MRAATTFAELSPALIAIRGKHGRFTFVNAAWTRLLGWSKGELLTRPFLDFVVDEDRALTLDAVRRYEAGNGPTSFVNRYLHVDGSTRTLLWNAIFDSRADAAYGIATDITERVAGEERRSELVAELERRGQQLTQLVELGRFAGGGAPPARVMHAAVRALANGLGTSHAAVYLGTPGDLAFAAGYGYESVAVSGDRLVERGTSQIGRTLETCVPFASGREPLARTPLQERSGIEASLSVPILRTIGIGVLCADDIVRRRFDMDDVAFAEACAALVASVVSRESGIAISAERDRPNAVLPTRAAFARALEARSANEHEHVVLSIDAPHDLDDEGVLATIDAALPGSLVGRETVRRFFVAAPATECARTAAEGLRDAFAPAAAEPASSAAGHLDRAMRADLRRAIENEEFFLVFQPIVDARRGTIIACEALVRWDHPQAGIIPPNDFIGMAEETGDIVALTRWVLHEATKQCRTWQRFAHDTVSVAVNISAVDLADAAFLDTVTHALRSASLPARYLTIEVTESVLMHDTARAARILEALRTFGAMTAIDDFGTGYSSLAYLKRLPFDALKIDRSFVREIATNEHDLALADAIVAVAKKFGMRATAEGVETLEQAHILRALGCDALQGYLFAKPVAAATVETLLRMPSLACGIDDTGAIGHDRAS